MKRFRGTVKNNVIVPEEGATLPEGTPVEVRSLTRRERLVEAVQRIRKQRINRPVGMQEIIEQDKQEREERWNFEGNPER